jgi:anti-anti-sigma regulatory factor
MWKLRRSAVETMAPVEVPRLPEHPTVVLDLTGVTWEAVSNCILSLRKEVRAADLFTRIVIKGASQEVRQHMKQCGIQSFFEFDDEAVGDVRHLPGT